MSREWISHVLGFFSFSIVQLLCPFILVLPLVNYITKQIIHYLSVFSCNDNREKKRKRKRIAPLWPAITGTSNDLGHLSTLYCTHVTPCGQFNNTKACQS